VSKNVNVKNISLKKYAPGVLGANKIARHVVRLQKILIKTHD